MISFTAATLSHSNLGGFGPDSGDQTMLISNVGSANGVGLNLQISSDAAYSVANTANNKVDNGFGEINVAPEATSVITFKWVDADGSPVTLDKFVFSFYDFDSGNDGKVTESMTVGGYSSYVVSDNTQVAISAASDGMTKFSATEASALMILPCSFC